MFASSKRIVAKVTEKTVVNCFLKANFMYDENCDLEVCYDNDNELEESFEDDEMETVEPVDFQLIDSPEVQNKESNDIILDYEDPKDDELIISMSN